MKAEETALDPELALDVPGTDLVLSLARKGFEVTQRPFKGVKGAYEISVGTERGTTPRYVEGPDGNVFAPPGTSPEDVGRLRREIAKLMEA